MKKHFIVIERLYNGNLKENKQVDFMVKMCCRYSSKKHVNRGMFKGK
jgi:hypothetical protein